MKRLRRTGFTVASLLLLTAVVAVYAAAIMSARNMDPQPRAEQGVLLAVLGLFFGTITGLFLGMFFGTRNRDIVLGVLEGAAFGPPTVFVLAIPDSFPVVLVGGVVLVGFAVTVRFLSPRKDPRHEKDDAP